MTSTGACQVPNMTENNEEKPLYKSFQQAPVIENAVVTDELKQQLLKFKDPIVLGSLMYTVATERENTNRILKNLLAKIDALETRIAELETEQVTPRGPRGPPVPMLPEADEKIVQFIRKRGRACADEVRDSLHYRGTNAASARMNKLFEKGVLEKQQVGRKVFYVLSKRD
jgi:hypothetical protein